MTLLLITPYPTSKPVATKAEHKQNAVRVSSWSDGTGRGAADEKKHPMCKGLASGLHKRDQRPRSSQQPWDTTPG